MRFSPHDYVSAFTYAEERSFLAWSARESSLWLVHRAVHHLERMPPEVRDEGQSHELRHRLRAELRQDIRDRKPRFGGFILSLLLPIIIRLVIEWWLARRNQAA